MTGADIIGAAITIAAAVAIWPHIRRRHEIRHAEREMTRPLSTTLIQSLSDRELLRYADQSDLMQRELATRLEICLDIIDDIKSSSKTPQTEDQRECCF